MENKSNKILWFLLIILLIYILLSILFAMINNKKNQKSLETIGKSSTDFITGIDNTKSHLNEFNYNYTTGKVDYKPSTISLNMYNKITEGMNEEEVIKILGTGEKLIGQNTYIISWGDLNLSKGYSIQITFDINSCNVISKKQVGLK